MQHDEEKSLPMPLLADGSGDGSSASSSSQGSSLSKVPQQKEAQPGSPTLFAQKGEGGAAPATLQRRPSVGSHALLLANLKRCSSSAFMRTEACTDGARGEKDRKSGEQGRWWSLSTLWSLLGCREGGQGVTLLGRFRLTFAGVTLLWALTGFLFFRLYSGLDASQALCFTVQAGLSVGFDMFSIEGEQTMLFVVGFVLIGAVLFSACLALFVEGVLNDQDAYNEVVAASLDALADNDLEGDGRMDYPCFEKHVLSNREWGFHRRDIPRLFRSLDKKGIGSLEMNDFRRFLEDARTSRATRLKLWWMCNTDRLRVLGALLTWIAMGTVYGVYGEGWSAARSVYFAVTALSTAGLQSPSEGALSMWFVSVFLITGIPVFAMALGQVASAIVDRYHDARLRDLIGGKVDAMDVEVVQRLEAKEGDVDKFEFLCLKLMTLGRLDKPLLDLIEQEFWRLDTDNKGKISRAELLQGALLSSESSNA